MGLLFIEGRFNLALVYTDKRSVPKNTHMHSQCNYLGADVDVYTGTDIES